MNGWWHHGRLWSRSTGWEPDNWCNGWAHWSGKDEPDWLDLVEVGPRVVYAWARQR